MRRRLRPGVGELHQRVVDDDAAQPERQPPKFAFLARVKTEGHAQQREHEARRRKRELLLDVHDLVVRRLMEDRDLLVPLLPQLRDGHLRKPVRDRGAAEDGLRVHLEGDLVRGGHRVDAGLRARHVLHRVVEDDGDQALFFVQREVARLGGHDRDLPGLTRIGQHDAQPTAARPRVFHVEHLAGKAFVEHPGLDVGIRLLAQEPRRDVLERLVAGRNQVDHHVERQARHHQGEQEHGPQQPERIDAAGEQRHGFPIARQPAEGHQEPGQEPHRDGQAQRLRQEHDEQECDRGDRNAASQEDLRSLEHGVDRQDEREQSQGQCERAHRFPDEIAVERAHWL